MLVMLQKSGRLLSLLSNFAYIKTKFPTPIKNAYGPKIRSGANEQTPARTGAIMRRSNYIGPKSNEQFSERQRAVIGHESAMR